MNQSGTQDAPNALARTVATAAAVRADLLLISQSSSHNDVCLVVAAPLAERTVEALRHEFSPDLMHERVEHAVIESAVSVVTLVGQKLRTASGTVGRIFAALGQEKVGIIATAQGSSDCSMSFVVPQQDVKRAIESLHRELELGGPCSDGGAADERHVEGRNIDERHMLAVASRSAIWKRQSGEASAD